MEIFFMLIGLGFFVFVIWLVLNQNNIEYNRQLNERREFGYRKQKRKDRKDFLSP